MRHGPEWPLSLPPSHASRTETERGGANGPWVGPPEPLAGPQEPQRSYSNVEVGVTSRRAVTPDAEPSPPPCPPPQLGRRGPHVRFEPASPVYRYTGNAGRHECGGAPHCPKRPAPLQLALEA